MYAIMDNKSERSAKQKQQDIDIPVEKERRKKHHHSMRDKKKKSKRKEKQRQTEKQRKQQVVDPTLEIQQYQEQVYDDCQNDGNTPTCFCDKSLRALKPQDVNLFLPKCLPCTCGKQEGAQDAQERRIHDEQMSLDEILRPWQAEFLKNEFMVTTISELTASCERIGPVMAREMRRWCKHSMVAPMVRDLQSCTLALFIWTKTCKLILASNRKGGALLYPVKARDPALVDSRRLATKKQKPGSNSVVPRVIVIPPSCKDDEVSACTSQGASTVLEDFLENIFHWEIPEDDDEDEKQKAKDPKKVEKDHPKADKHSDEGWDLMTRDGDEFPEVKISNMEEVVVSLEMYGCMDKTMSRTAMEKRLNQMSSVLNRVNINLITTDSPATPEDDRSMQSLRGGSAADSKNKQDDEEEDEVSLDTTETEPTTKSTAQKETIKAPQPHHDDEAQEHLTRVSTHAMRPRRRNHWSSSIAYLAAFDEAPEPREKTERK